MTDRTIHIRPRYYRRMTDPGVEMLEANGRYAHLDWTVPLGELALVCIDVWDRDIHADMRAEDERVTRERIVPVVEACRKAGVTVVHAPAWPTAQGSGNWLNLVGDEQERKVFADSPDWPPSEFRRRTGPWARYARPAEPRAAECDLINNPPGFDELVRPVGDEPVIATGEELHRLCAARGWVHLVYVGFHMPGCVTNRTYGPVKMMARGYSCILLRDCTNGMESHETFADKLCMRGAITFL
ncbi:MAG: isochorismatase family protein, partial [Planctomycetes bacterium]|nr:isochorismatase family protein [Planctomycetota bacterium]